MRSDVDQLVEKVISTIDAGPRGGGYSKPVMEEATQLPRWIGEIDGDGPFGDGLLGARDWILYYGIAVGIARAEDVWEPIDSVAQRAYVAAVELYKQQNCVDGKRPQESKSVPGV